MGKPYGVDATGQPVNLIGQPMPTSYVPEEVQPMKAEKSGIYVAGKYRFWANAGDAIVDGAEPVLIEERAEKAAPQNRAEKAAPQNRSAKSDKKAD